MKKFKCFDSLVAFHLSFPASRSSFSVANILLYAHLLAGWFNVLSGWLAIRLGLVVGKEGKVVSYEWREDFAELAEKNVAKAGLAAYVEVKRKSVFDGIDEKEVDLITLDLADSEKALPAAFAALKHGGFVVGYSPNVEQVRRFVDGGLACGFEQFRVVETIEREWLVRPQGCRPATMGLFHTAFLSFLRKPAPNAKPKPSGE